MKKTIALILATILLVGLLAGCGQSTDTGSGNNETQAQTQAPTEAPTAAPTEAPTQAPTQAPAAVGDILDAPEVTFDTSIEDLYISFVSYGETGDTMIEMTFDQVTADSYVIYLTNGSLALDEIVYEVTGTNITKYYRGAFDDNFTADATLTSTELQAEVDDALKLVSLFMIAGEQWANVKFQKTNVFAFSLAGDVYTYNIIENGAFAGEIWVHAETGLLAQLEDANGAPVFSVTSIKTSNIEIPAYK